MFCTVTLIDEHTSVCSWLCLSIQQPVLVGVGVVVELLLVGVGVVLELLLVGVGVVVELLLVGVGVVVELLLVGVGVVVELLSMAKPFGNPTVILRTVLEVPSPMRVPATTCTEYSPSGTASFAIRFPKLHV